MKCLAHLRHALKCAKWISITVWWSSDGDSGDVTIFNIRICIHHALLKLYVHQLKAFFHCSISKDFFQTAEWPELEFSPGHSWVPYNHISIRVLGDSAFLRVEVEDFCCVAAGDSHKSILVHFATMLRGEENAQSTQFELGGHTGWQQYTELADKRSVQATHFSQNII